MCGGGCAAGIIHRAEAAEVEPHNSVAILVVQGRAAVSSLTCEGGGLRFSIRMIRVCQERKQSTS